MNREGIILLVFDLPMNTKEEKRNYAKFRKSIIGDGYIMFQESVYIKLIKNMSSFKQGKNNLSKFAPKNGKISIFPISINSFKKGTTIIGEEFNYSLFYDPIIYISA